MVAASSSRPKSPSPPGCRGVASSPLGICMARPPRMGPWRGPLPRRRITPLPVLGHFIDKAASGSGATTSAPANVSRPHQLAAPPAFMAGVPQDLKGHRLPEEVVVEGVAVPVQTPANPMQISSDVTKHASDPVHPHGWGHLVRRFRTLWARRPRVLIEQPIINAPPSLHASARPPGTFSPTPSLLPRSFNSVAGSSSGSTSSSALSSRSPSSAQSHLFSSSTPHQAPLERTFAAVVGSVLMLGQRPPSVGAPGAPRLILAPAQQAAAQPGPRQPAPVVTPQAAGRPSALALGSSFIPEGAGGQFTAVSQFGVMPTGPRPLQPLQPPSRQPDPPAYMLVAYPQQSLGF
jgi:hypothetical protein